MLTPNVFIISYRSWEQDDLEYGTFSPIFITLQESLANRLFNRIVKDRMMNGNIRGFKQNGNFIEYQKGKKFHQYKLEGFVREQFELPKDDMNIIVS